MSPWLAAVVWLVAGAGASLVHLWRLYTLVQGLGDRTDKDARRRLTRFAPLRILAYSPLLLGAALSGLVGCIGLVAGILFGRLVGMLVMRPTPTSG